MKLLVIALVSVLHIPEPSAAPTIGVFADSLGTDCNLTVPFPGPPVKAYVVARSLDGFVGASFRVSGFPEGWDIEATVNPEAIMLGDCFGEGVRVALGLCHVDPLVLFTLAITPGSTVQGVAVRIEKHSNTLCCDLYPKCWECPAVIGCDAVPCNFHCVQSVKSTINGDDCGLTVDPGSWTTIKGLFR